MKPGRAPVLQGSPFTPQPGAFSLFVQECATWDAPVVEQEMGEDGAFNPR